MMTSWGDGEMKPLHIRTQYLTKAEYLMWSAGTIWNSTRKYINPDDDMIRMLVADYCDVVPYGGMQEEALRDLVKIVMGSECADSNLLRNIVELFLFLWKKQLRSGGGNGGGVSVATAALRNPACPTDLLHRALFSKNAAYCLAASQNPNLPEEDQVQWALTPRKRYQPL